MNASPGIDGLLEGIMVGLGNEIMPFLNNEKALATAAMMQSILQGVRQSFPIYLAALVEEHNSMTSTLREVGATLSHAQGAESDRIKDRAATLGQLLDLPTPVALEETLRAHTELSKALESTIGDLDVIQRSGSADAAAADAALNAIRAHLAPRYLRDHLSIVAGSGFLGRG
jgi:hypothetical protein